MRDGILTELEGAVAILEELEAELPDFGGRVEVADHPGRVDLILDHPGARHALTARMMREMAQGLLVVYERRPAWLVVRSSDSRAFCSGGHLGQVRSGLLATSAASKMTRAMSAVTAAFGALPSISVALIEGPAIGGGLELALSCDVRLMNQEAWLHPAQASLGVVQGWGGARGWVRSAGYGDALLLLAQSERMTAAEAWSRRLVQYVGPERGDALLVAGIGSALDRGAEVLHAIKAQLRDPRDEAASRVFLGVWGADAHLRALAR